MKISKKAKLGILGATFYTATTLAAPIYATVEQNTKPNNQLTLEQATTIEQIDSLYNQKLIDYTSDKVIEHSEIVDLKSIQEKKFEILKVEHNPLEEEYNEKIKRPVDELETQIRKLSEKVHYGKANVLDDINTKLKEGILIHYPALLNSEKGKNVTYASDTPIEQGLVEPFREIIKEADDLLKQYYDDNNLEFLITKESYDINNLLGVYHLLKDKKGFTSSKMKKQLNDKIAALQEEIEVIGGSEEKKTIKAKLDSIEINYKKIRDIYSDFSTYLDAKEDTEKFEKKFGDFSKQVSISFLKNDFLDNEVDISYLESHNAIWKIGDRYEGNIQSSTKGLEEHFKEQGYDVEVKDIHNPAKPLLPYWWLGMAAGLFLPVIRNLIIKKYIKGSETSGEEMFYSGMGGLINGAVGVFLIDGLHPLIFPARMLTPVVLQPLFKYGRMKSAKKNSAKKKRKDTL
ncbi:MAG: hypothetical protein L6408_07625 [Nanoarchaeota archaeon]|nr:hypothetical protein [Nanoarchaeota archaeon]